MANYSVWILEESNISVSGGESLDGITQGDGSNLEGEFITLNNTNWKEVTIRDGGSDANFDDNDGNQRLDGAQTIDGVTYSDGTRVEAEYRIQVQDSDGNVYDVIGFNVRNSNPAYGTVEGLAFVGPPQSWPPVGDALEVVDSFEGPGGSGQSAIAAEDLVAPCFTPGTMIATAAGLKPVEDLQLGDLIQTLDNGLQPVRWIGQVTLTKRQLDEDPTLRPIHVRRDTFGQHQPSRDMMFSPQHRVLLRGWQAELFLGTSEGLAAIGHLVNDQSITRSAKAETVTYVHFMFDRHELVCADGIWAESFLLGPMTWGALGHDAQRELEKLFPGMVYGQLPNMQAARPMLKKWEAALFA